MFKKGFVLASVTALYGAVATVGASGCSSTDNSGATVADASEASFDARRPFEAGPDEPVDSGPATCPTTTPIDATTSVWKPPAIMRGACSEAEIKALVTVVDKNPMVAYADLKASVTDATCKACLFAPDGAKWAAFVEDSKGAFLRHNFGGCVAAVSGQDTCGKAYSQYDDCINQACTDCADQAAFDKCSSPASKGEPG